MCQPFNLQECKKIFAVLEYYHMTKSCYEENKNNEEPCKKHRITYHVKPDVRPKVQFYSDNGVFGIPHFAIDFREPHKFQKEKGKCRFFVFFVCSSNSCHPSSGLLQYCLSSTSPPPYHIDIFLDRIETEVILQHSFLNIEDDLSDSSFCLRSVMCDSMGCFTIQ